MARLVIPESDFRRTGTPIQAAKAQKPTVGRDPNLALVEFSVDDSVPEYTTTNHRTITTTTPQKQLQIVRGELKGTPQRA